MVRIHDPQLINITMYKNYLKWRKYISILYALLILYFLYSIGTPIYYIPIIGIFFILFILLRGPAYNKINILLIKKFSFVEKLSPWIKKLLIILIFILIFTLLKQVVFISLKMIGIDIQEMILKGINQGNF